MPCAFFFTLQNRTASASALVCQPQQHGWGCKIGAILSHFCWLFLLIATLLLSWRRWRSRKYGGNVPSGLRASIRMTSFLGLEQEVRHLGDEHQQLPCGSSENFNCRTDGAWVWPAWTSGASRRGESTNDHNPPEARLPLRESMPLLRHIPREAFRPEPCLSEPDMFAFISVASGCCENTTSTFPAAPSVPDLLITEAPKDLPATDATMLSSVSSECCEEATSTFPAAQVTPGLLRAGAPSDSHHALKSSYG